MKKFILTLPKREKITRRREGKGSVDSDSVNEESGLTQLQGGLNIS